MNIKDFLKEYTISKQMFAELVHVGLRTFNKYIAGEKIRDDAREKIERGVRITIEHDLKCPRCGNNADWWTYSLYRDELYKYKKYFTELFEAES